eukprot:COSAG02_NODE_7407_length_3031_cov_1.984311_1_plen_446_part_00
MPASVRVLVVALGWWVKVTMGDPIGVTCAHGCALTVAECNASDPLQSWLLSPYTPGHENALVLTGTPLCVNVKAYGTATGDEVWVTHCGPEHPDHANRNWSIFDSELYNARSKKCLTMSQQVMSHSGATESRRLQQAKRHAVLGDCGTALKWTQDQHLLRSSDGCLVVDRHSGPPGPGNEPSPPFPNPLPAPSTVAATLELGGQIATSGGPSYASFNFDWHCGASDAAEYNCPAEPGWNHSSVNFGLDLEDPHMIAAAKALAPGRLRIGGSQGDCICYDIPAGSCAAEIQRHPRASGSYGCNSPAFVLNMTRWQQIVEWCEATGIQLVFGLNGDTRDGYSSPLDWKRNNTENFVKHVAQHNAKHIYGFEVGNEKCGAIDPKVYAADMIYLRKLVDENWQSGETKPLVIAPDCNPIGGQWVTDFLGNASVGSRPAADVFTYHNYVG